MLKLAEVQQVVRHIPPPLPSDPSQDQTVQFWSNYFTQENLKPQSGIELVSEQFQNAYDYLNMTSSSVLNCDLSFAEQSKAQVAPTKGNQVDKKPQEQQLQRSHELMFKVNTQAQQLSLLTKNLTGRAYYKTTRKYGTRLKYEASSFDPLLKLEPNQDKLSEISKDELKQIINLKSKALKCSIQFLSKRLRQTKSEIEARKRDQDIVKPHCPNLRISREIKRDKETQRRYWSLLLNIRHSSLFQNPKAGLFQLEKLVRLDKSAEEHYQEDFLKLKYFFGHQMLKIAFFIQEFYSPDGNQDKSKFIKEGLLSEKRQFYGVNDIVKEYMKSLNLLGNEDMQTKHDKTFQEIKNMVEETEKKILQLDEDGKELNDNVFCYQLIVPRNTDVPHRNLDFIFDHYSTHFERDFVNKEEQKMVDVYEYCPELDRQTYFQECLTQIQNYLMDKNQQKSRAHSQSGHTSMINSLQDYYKNLPHHSASQSTFNASQVLGLKRQESTAAPDFDAFLQNHMWYKMLLDTKNYPPLSKVDAQTAPQDLAEFKKQLLLKHQQNMLKLQLQKKVYYQFFIALNQLESQFRSRVGQSKAHNADINYQFTLGNDFILKVRSLRFQNSLERYALQLKQRANFQRKGIKKLNYFVLKSIHIQLFQSLTTQAKPSFELLNKMVRDIVQKSLLTRVLNSQIKRDRLSINKVNMLKDSFCAHYDQGISLKVRQQDITIQDVFKEEVELLKSQNTHIKSQSQARLGDRLHNKSWGNLERGYDNEFYKQELI